MSVEPTELEDRADVAAAELPIGTPAWITPELVRLTLRVWQPYYQAPLTTHDAVTILLSAGRLLRIFTKE